MLQSASLPFYRIKMREIITCGRLLHKSACLSWLHRFLSLVICLRNWWIIAFLYACDAVIFFSTWFHINREVYLVVDIELVSFLASALEVFRKTPGILSHKTICHIFNFWLIAGLLRFLNHVLVNFNEVDNSIIFSDCRLFRTESDFSIHNKVIIIKTFFHILYIW